MLARQVDELEVDPFFLRFLAGIERGLAGTDHALLLRVLDDEGPVDTAAYERLAAQGRVDGFLLCDVELDDPRFAVLAQAGLPVVVAGHPGRARAQFPALETRHADGLAEATAHVIALSDTSGSALSSAAACRFEYEQARPGGLAGGAPRGRGRRPAPSSGTSTGAPRRADRACLHERRARGGRARRRPRAGWPCPSGS